MYSNKFNDATRPIKQLRFKSENTQTIENKDTYSGVYNSTVIVKRGKKLKGQPVAPYRLQQVVTQNAYENVIPLKPTKFSYI